MNNSKIFNILLILLYIGEGEVSVKEKLTLVTKKCGIQAGLILENVQGYIIDKPLACVHDNSY